LKKEVKDEKIKASPKKEEKSSANNNVAIKKEPVDET